jgi:hypothetical protein
MTMMRTKVLLVVLYNVTNSVVISTLKYRSVPPNSKEPICIIGVTLTRMPIITTSAPSAVNIFGVLIVVKIHNNVLTFNV